MDGRRDGPGQRWRGGNSNGGSEKPVSSYASLACGPPPSYARQGSNNSWDYDDMPQQRPPSPPTGPPRKGPPFFSRGGGMGRGRYNDGGRGGRPFRGGGRERNDNRFERFSEHTSPDRFQSNSSNDRSNTNQSGYESGEIAHIDRAPTHRSSANTGHSRRMEERSTFEGRGGRSSDSYEGRGGRSSDSFEGRGGRSSDSFEGRGGRSSDSFEGRGGRSGDGEGRGSGRFIPRGGGRDAGRGGRAQRGGGRYFDRGGGRGGRSDYRGRGRDGDVRDPYNNSGKEWTPAGGRSTTPDTSQRFMGSDTSSRPPDDGPQRFYGGGGGGDSNVMRKEPMYSSRGDDRGNQQGRSFPGNPVGRGRYTSLGSDPEIPPNRNPENRPDDRFGKRRRDDQGFHPMDYEDKRTRNNEYVPRNRPPEDSRPFPSGGGPPPHHSTNDGGPPNLELRPPLARQGSDSRGMIDPDRRVMGPRGGLDGPPMVDDVGGALPIMSHDDRRGRGGMDVPGNHGSFNAHHNDPRSRIPPMNDEPRDLDPVHRADKRPGLSTHPNDEPRMGSTMHRDDPRGALPPRGRIGPPHREDPRKVPDRFRDDTNVGAPPQRHLQRHEFQKDPSHRDPRPPVDSRPRIIQKEDNIQRSTPRAFEPRDDPRSEARVVDDLYGDMSPVPNRTQGLQHDGPSRPPDNMPPVNSDRGRDFQGSDDFRSHHMGGDSGGRKDDFRQVHSHGPQGPDVSRNLPPENKGHAGGWAPQAPQPPSQPFITQPQPHNRNMWNSSQNRSPRPSPGSVRRTILPPGTDQAPPFQDSGPVEMPTSFPDNRGPGLDNRGSFADDRALWRGRGLRGRGRGRSDFGRFGGGGRGQNEFFRNIPTSRDGPDIQQSPYRALEDGWNRRNDGTQEKEELWPTPSSSAPPDRSIPHQQQHVTQQPVPANSNEVPESRKQQRRPSDQTGQEKDTAQANPVPSAEEKQEEKGPRPVSPPPPGKPSGATEALARLVDLEAQMEYAYAKHMQLVNRQKELQAQAKVLSDLPVGVEAFKEDLEALGAGGGRAFFG